MVGTTTQQQSENEVRNFWDVLMVLITIQISRDLPLKEWLPKYFIFFLPKQFNF